MGGGETCRETCVHRERERETETETETERQTETDRQHTYKGRELDLAAPLSLLCQPDIRGH